MEKLKTIVALGVLCAGTAFAQPSPVYIGSFNVNQGPDWNGNPPVYSGVEAAALLFGGAPGDYAISTNSNTADASTITNTAWYDGWGTSCTEFAENYSLDVAPPGYADPGGVNTSWSAYVSDHGCGQTNYVWRINSTPSTPVPTLPILGLALTALAVLSLALRRLRSVARTR